MNWLPCFLCFAAMLLVVFVVCRGLCGCGPRGAPREPGSPPVSADDRPPPRV